jgi:hypothetical protein
MFRVNFHSFKPEQGSHRYEGVDGHFPALELCLKTLSPACPSHQQTPRRHKSHLMAFVRRQRQIASVNYSESHRAERSEAKVIKVRQSRCSPFGKFL